VLDDAELGAPPRTPGSAQPRYTRGVLAKFAASA
jgi:hypothetical protein